MVGTVTIAFVTPDTLSLLPTGSTAAAFVIVIGVVPTVGASVRLTVAATPAAIMLALVVPVSRQITEPVPGAQYTVLPAAVATGPGSTEMAEIWLDG
jgi:hypothetical protein